MQLGDDKAERRRLLRRMFDDVNRKRDRSEYTAARTQLLEMMKIAPRARKLKVVFAETYREQGDPQQAIELFRKVVDVFPEYELASLALYHTLWEQGLTEEAFAEMKRYLKTGRRSQDYADIVKEIAQDGA